MNDHGAYHTYRKIAHATVHQHSENNLSCLLVQWVIIQKDVICSLIVSRFYCKLFHCVTLDRFRPCHQFGQSYHGQ